jgi:aryl sulfotransferase
MKASQTPWPVKTREHESGLSNSAYWNDFEFRDDDIVVATYPKSGTTLVQQIVAQLVFDADPEVFGLALSPWVEGRRTGDETERLLSVGHRRFLKTHLPVDALVYSPEAKYIAVGRDPRDVVWSLHNHVTGLRRQSLAELGDRAPSAFSQDVREFYHAFLNGSDVFRPYWPHVQSWWDIRHLPNMLTLHYANLLADLPGQIRSIAAFLDIQVDEAKLPRVIDNCSLAHMRKLGAGNESLNQTFERGAETFINKGTNGRWRDVLSPAEIARCDEIAARRLTVDCAGWLRTGELPDV